MRFITVSVFVVVLSSNVADSRELRVAVEPELGEYGSVQAAIDAAEAGDVVVVAPGEYGVRPITFLGKPITVRSERGPDVTVLRMVDTESFQRASVVVFDSGEGRDSVLEGFTLTGGTGTNAGDACILSKFAGGGIVCVGDSGPTVRDCVLTENTLLDGEECADGYGAGVAAVCYEDFLMPCTGSPFPLLIDCVFTEHRGTGSTIFCDAGEMTLIGCTVVENGRNDEFRGGTIWCDGGSIVLESTIVASNVGRGVVVGSGAVRVSHATITANSAGGVLCETNAAFSSSSSILWNGNSESLVPSDATAGIAVTKVVRRLDRRLAGRGQSQPGSSILWVDIRGRGDRLGDERSALPVSAANIALHRDGSRRIDDGSGRFRLPPELPAGRREQ